MSSYYDDPDFADEMLRRDEEALDAELSDRERAALGATPGICRDLNDARTFMCYLDTGHEGDHHGFELPTVTLDEAF